MATLYLPTLNASIIDKGIATGDTAYIWRVGVVMLAVTLVQVGFSIGAVYFGSRTAMGVRARRAQRPVPPRDGLLGAGGRDVRRTHPDHPHHQRRPAGPDARAAVVHAARRRADRRGRRRHLCAARGPRAVEAAAGQHPGADHLRRSHRVPDGAAVPPDAGPHRRHQQGAARADHRPPCRAGIRARTPRGPPLRRRQRRAHGHVAAGRAADGADVPDRRARAQRLERRRAVVRRRTRRRRLAVRRFADRLPQLPDTDPDGRDDGHLHGPPRASRRGVGRPHPGGARHRAVGRAAR